AARRTIAGKRSMAPYPSHRPKVAKPRPRRSRAEVSCRATCPRTAAAAAKRSPNPSQSVARPRRPKTAPAIALIDHSAGAPLETGAGDVMGTVVVLSRQGRGGNRNFPAFSARRDAGEEEGDEE